MRIAVVGGGVSGLTTAWALKRAGHDVTLWEAEPRLGGHAHTHDVEHGGRSWRLDTGFLVLDANAYPEFQRLLATLGVGTQPSDMSLSVRCRACGLELAFRGLRALLAQPTNLARPSFWRLFLGLRRFFADARAFLRPPQGGAPADPDLTLGAFLERGRYGDAFERHWLLPTAGAVWSAPFGAIRDYSARMLLAFFEHHGFLQVRQHAWRAVAGASRTYVDALSRALGTSVRLGAPIARVTRGSLGAEVTPAGAAPERFDQVVLAVHADHALRLLGDADPEERAALGAFRYAGAQAVLHTDRSFLPRARAAWASWNCEVHDCRDESAPVSVTYLLNRLQALDSPTPFLVTLNARRRPEGVLREMSYEHPLLTRATASAQAGLRRLAGSRATHFAGAHLYAGFHEDGVRSALDVARALGAAPW